MRGKDELYWTLRLFSVRLRPWLAFHSRRHAYRFLTVEQLAETRRSDTVFIFGSGASLNELGRDEWARIAEHDTLGFNWFVHQRFVRCDYHLIRGIPDDDRYPKIWRPQVEEYFALLRENPCFERTIFLVQTGFRAINGNRAIGYKYLPTKNPVFAWRSSIRVGEPSRSFDEGLVHGQSTIQESINFAYLLGWKRIVLAGVDLYDRRYFWLPEGETRTVDSMRGATASDAHVQASMGLVDALGSWREWLAGEGVELSVHNPRSLARAALPVYEFAPV
jgi:hypothetical protein